MCVCACVVQWITNTPFLALRLAGVTAAPSPSGACDEFSSAHNWLKHEVRQGKKRGKVNERERTEIEERERGRETERGCFDTEQMQSLLIQAAQPLLGSCASQSTYLTVGTNSGLKASTASTLMGIQTRPVLG